MKPLDFFYKRNTEWVKMAKNVCGGDPNVYQEVLQEAYLRIHNTKEDKVEDFENRHPNEISIYMWLTLKSCYIAYQKELQRSQPLPEDYDKEDEEYSEGPDKTPLFRQIEAIISDFHWYDEKLFKLHYYEGKAMRKIARETNISVSSIFHTIKTCRETIKEFFDEHRN